MWGVLDTHLERTSKRPEGTATMEKLEGFAQAMSLRDVWRELHVGAKGYSNYSGAYDGFEDRQPIHTTSSDT